MKKLLFILCISSIVLYSYLYKPTSPYQPIKNSYISLMPSLTEIIYAINAEDNLLAVTDYSTYPPAAKLKPSIGSAFFINKEQILKYKPEKIFAVTYAKPYIDDLKSMGIQIYYYNYESIDAVIKSIQSIGKETNHVTEAKALIKKIKRTLSLEKKPNPKRMLYLISSKPFMSVGNKSYISDLIKQSGFINITENLNIKHPIINLEYAISKNPDIIVLSVHNYHNNLHKLFPNALIHKQNYQQAELIVRPGPRLVQAIEYMQSLN